MRDLLHTGTLKHKDSVKLMIQIAEAVEFARRSKILHRDLKTSNILVDHDNKAYVVDFGLSRRDDAEITMTVDGAIVGTVQYMSPEQAIGNQAEVGPRSDIYSLGVILYELICKEFPFHGSKRMVIEQVINDEPRSPHRLNESVPRDLETITLKAMAKTPVNVICRLKNSPMTLGAGCVESRFTLDRSAISPAIGVGVGDILLSLRSAPRLWRFYYSLLRFQ